MIVSMSVEHTSEESMMGKRWDRIDKDTGYRLKGHSVYVYDGSEWYVIDDDCPSDLEGFAYRCDFLAEEARVLAAEARKEFGYAV